VKLAHVELCGFRGYRKHIRIDFADGFTIIDGRNGVGKSTIFDAIEFALTGDIAKYEDATADRESVADYIWWNGEGVRPETSYVEVAFADGDHTFPIRRAQFGKVNDADVDAIVQRLCDRASSPEQPLKQLVASSIIRDEHIAKLSLDLKEAERYQRLRDAIGATDADAWILRAQHLRDKLRNRVQDSQDDVERAEAALAAATRRIDELRRGLAEEQSLSEAAARLNASMGTALAMDQLGSPARVYLSNEEAQLEKLESLHSAFDRSSAARARIADNVAKLEAAQAELESSKEALTAAKGDLQSTEVIEGIGEADRARDLALLAELGQRLGLHGTACPLCQQQIDEAEYGDALRRTLAYANALSAEAVLQADRKRRIDRAEQQVEALNDNVQGLILILAGLRKEEREYADRAISLGFAVDVPLEEIRQSCDSRRANLNVTRNDIRIVETLKLNTELQRALGVEASASASYAKAQEKLGLARRSEGHAQAIHDAARRATGETLGRRLDRVLPLMAELYQRMRPHPTWTDLEYKIRGDVRRFLRLQVGGDLNPQFMFSSGQRRATGLAFLLAVNLALAWSKWQSVLLDDPVQHIDDFRSIQLAEVLAQLVSDGRQIICAVEDPALAELLCRRLPADGPALGRRITLGNDDDGALTKLYDQPIAPLSRRALLSTPDDLAI
jgi:chromosome segregation protein